MAFFKRFYGDYVVNGLENLPKNGPVIYAANHLNALMDPLAVISVLPHKMPIVYLARSDYFKNEKVRKMLTFCKLLPAFRMREGIGNLEKNHEVFDKCVEVLDHNTPLGIMPEGNQGGFRRLRPLVKGIFRIAFTAQQKYGTQQGVKIVPVGIDLGDFEKYGKHLIVNIGKPIEVAEYMTDYYENQAAATNRLRERLSDELIQLTLNLDTQEHYDCFETATEVANTAMVEDTKKQNNTLQRFFARQKIANHLVGLEKHKPEVICKLDEICKEYKENLKRLNLRSWVFEHKGFKATQLTVSFLLLLITFPVFLIGFILNILPFMTPDITRRLLKIKAPGGLSSLRYGFGMVSFPLFYLMQGILIYKKIRCDFWNLIFIIPMQYIFGKLSFYWYKSYKKLMAKWRYRKLEKQNSPELMKTIQLHKEIIRIVRQAS